MTNQHNGATVQLSLARSTAVIETKGGFQVGSINVSASRYPVQRPVTCLQALQLSLMGPEWTLLCVILRICAVLNCLGNPETM